MSLRALPVLTLLLTACAAPHAAPLRLADCLPGAQAPWRVLAAPPPDAARLAGLARSPIARPFADPRETWHRAGDGRTLLCRFDGECLVEAWQFAGPDRAPSRVVAEACPARTPD